MSRWFRHYAGMMRDDKLVRVAIRSKQTIERVVWIWGVILESAAEIDDGGRFDVDAAECAYFLRADESDVSAIISELETSGRLHQGAVAKWGDRQFQSDTSAERQRRYRERKALRDTGGSDQPYTDDGNADSEVTSLSRHGDAPETETETETEAKAEASPAKAVEAKRGRKRAAVAVFEIPDWVPKPEWQAFLRMRKEIKHPITADGIPLAIDRLDKLRQAGNDPATVLNRSTMNSWRGLFKVSGEDDPTPAKVTPIRELTAEEHERMAEHQDTRDARKAAFHRGEAARLRKSVSIGSVLENATQSVRMTQ